MVKSETWEALPVEDAVCADCRRLFDGKTGQKIEGWEGVRWIEGGPFVCGACKEHLIEWMAREVTA